MKTGKPIQYTIRGVPPRVDRALREQAARYGKSLNELALDAIQAASGLSPEAVRHHDLDALAGAWVREPACDEAIQSFRTIDPALWK